jgi:hypothetical protein
MEADDLEIGEWWRSWVKGKIAGCVRGRETPERVSQAVHAVFRRGRLQSHDVDRIVEEVKAVSVDPFISDTWREPARRERLEALISALGLAKHPVGE